MTRSSVDLPQPDGPMSEMNSPAPDLEVDALERGRDRGPAGEDLVDARDRGRPARPIGPGSATAVHRGHPSAAPGRPRSATSSSRADHHEERDAQQRRDEDRRPQLLGTGDVLLVEVDDRATEAVGDPARALADDRPDDRRGRGDLERREQVRHRGRQADLAIRRPAPGRVRAHQLERPRVGRPKAADHRDRDREERQVGGDDHDRGHVRPDGEDDHRREGHDRDRLAGDDVRHERPLGQSRMDEDRRQQQAEQRADDEADDRLTPGVERGADEELAERILGVALHRRRQRGQDVEPVRQVQVGRERPAERREVLDVDVRAEHVLEPPRHAADELDRPPR